MITDVCLCGYTDHGHCGVVVDGEVHNDLTLELLARTAVSHADAGADVVAPSDMMDGRVGRDPRRARRRGPRGGGDPRLLGQVRVGLLRPLPRGRRLGAGLRRPARLPDGPGQRRARPCARRCSTSAEGADMVMVKPAAAYLDVIAGVRAATDLPLAAYHVSGEYAMLKAAAERGWLDERRRDARDAHRHRPRGRRPAHHLLRRGRRPLDRRGRAVTTTDSPPRASATSPTRPTASCSTSSRRAWRWCASPTPRSGAASAWTRRRCCGASRA